MPTEQEKHKKELRAKAMRLPLHPGVYLMHDKTGKIIYVGKAKALKNRVSQYFGSERNHDRKVRQMVANVKSTWRDRPAMDQTGSLRNAAVQC